MAKFTLGIPTEIIGGILRRKAEKEEQDGLAFVHPHGCVPDQCWKCLEEKEAEEKVFDQDPGTD